ncbi:hypothetical protein AB4Z48_25605 [Cupriavidus sp. 2TAF22]|uniref:hypothetical protein n=1 Tax=unclassified Cupriavidus TaxID=2640874 RepID=UPI003F93A8ED
MPILALALKLWRNRPRGNNVPYVPAWRFEGDIEDTAALRGWLLERAGTLP